MKSQWSYLDVCQLRDITMKYLKVNAMDDKMLFYVAFMLLLITYINTQRQTDTITKIFKRKSKPY